MAVQIQIRHGNEAVWASANPILMIGEMGNEVDTGRFKVGNGVDHWNDLPYSSGVPGEKGDKGDQGDPGPTGATGAQGPKGDKGDTGDTGPQGEKGDKGDQGDPGPKGDKGDTGDQGPQGPAGADGADGADGAQGPKGDKGDTGDTGPQGPKGDKGDTGDTGPTGATGAKGDKGDPGEGVPTGGDAGQVLVKQSSTDYDAEWEDYNSGREVLIANRTYYVRPDGDNSNDGLSNTSGGAFLTIQKAIDTAAGLDSSIYSVTIQVADGTYTGSNQLKNMVGAGSITIQGNSGTPSNVLIDVTNANNFVTSGLVTNYTIRDMKLQNATAGSCISSDGGSGIISVNNIVFGATSTAHIRCNNGAKVTISGNYSITGGGVWHMLADLGGIITGVSKTVTITGTPSFANAFCQASSLSEIYMINMTYSGSATGARYIVTSNAYINTNNAGQNYFPGNSGGSITNGGIYDDVQTAVTKSPGDNSINIATTAYVDNTKVVAAKYLSSDQTNWENNTSAQNLFTDTSSDTVTLPTGYYLVKGVLFLDLNGTASYTANLSFVNATIVAGRTLRTSSTTDDGGTSSGTAGLFELNYAGNSRIGTSSSTSRRRYNFADLELIVQVTGTAVTPQITFTTAPGNTSQILKAQSYMTFQPIDWATGKGSWS